MFDEPNESPAERPIDPEAHALSKSDALRMHAELAAVFEATRKYEARLLPTLEGNVAREIQRTIGKLEKSKTPDSPILPPAAVPDAAAMLDFPCAHDLSTNDYHIHRRPGEVMIVRWLAGEQVETYYQRLQAHFDAAIEGFREDERQANEWKQDPKALAYLEALDKIEVRMADRYLRDFVRRQRLDILSTQTADELNIEYLADQIMGATAADLVGAPSAPPEAPTEQDLAWFFKLFSLRGMIGDEERMCFFAYLQKTDDAW